MIVKRTRDTKGRGVRDPLKKTSPQRRPKTTRRKKTKLNDEQSKKTSGSTTKAPPEKELAKEKQTKWRDPREKKTMKSQKGSRQSDQKPKTHGGLKNERFGGWGKNLLRKGGRKRNGKRGKVTYPKERGGKIVRRTLPPRAICKGKKGMIHSRRAPKNTENTDTSTGIRKKILLGLRKD